MKFIIQTIDGNIKHDFSFQLLRAIDYYNWSTRHENIEYTFAENISDFKPNYIAIGTVEFVLSYLKKYYNKEPNPINIPDELFKEEFLKRECEILKSQDIKGNKFVKSNDKIKGFTEIVNNNNKIPDGNYLVSDIIEIESEWRAFVFNKRLVGLENYTGDFTLFPDIKIINNMIKSYKNSPPAYTLDVGINSETFLIEVHDFFSCGLYGFENLEILPKMYSQWWNYFLNK